MTPTTDPSVTPTTRPSVSIVVAPRERFSCARRSLESILEHTDHPFELIYVDGGSPRRLREYLRARAASAGFTLLRTNHYLTPNEARNLGLARARGRYVVFVDNDVVVAPGWLSPLVRCAEETGATVVSPLLCQGSPLHQIVHCVGGKAAVAEHTVAGRTERSLFEQILHQGKAVDALRPALKREPTELAEFHCMLVRREHFERFGALDARILNTREQVDFSMTVLQAGGTIWLEPASVVTYLYDAPMRWGDYCYYMVRWSDRWELQSLSHLETKWKLTGAGLESRKRRIGWRRRGFVIRPLVRTITRGRGGKRFHRVLEAVIARLERPLNRILSRVYGHRSLTSSRAGSIGAAHDATS